MPDLLNTVPLSTLGLSAEQALVLQEAKRKGEGVDENDKQEGKEEDSLIMDTDLLEDQTNLEIEADKDGLDDQNEVVDESRATKLALLLDEKLLDSTNKKKADEFTIAFCNLNRLFFCC